MVHDHPVVEVVEREAAWEDDDGQGVQLARVLEDHADAIPQVGFGGVDVVFYLVEFEGEYGENEGVFNDGTENHEDAGHDESIYGIEFCWSRWGCIGADVIENIDDDKEEDN